MENAEDKKEILIHSSDDVREVLSACGKSISQLLDIYKDQDVFLLASGGSALGVLGSIDYANIGPHVHMCVVDERYGVEKEDQNYYLLSQTDFAREFIARGGVVCDTAIDKCATLQDAEHLFEQHFSAIAEKGSKGEVVVITLLGVGADGHTAGIMPYPGEAHVYRRMFHAQNKFAVGYDAGEKNAFPKRVTASGSFLVLASDHAIVYAVGADKRDVLRKIVDTEGEESTHPARIVHEMRDVHIYTDQRLGEVEDFS